MAASASYSMSSLYVGDLHADVNEAMLFEKFSVSGHILSIRVCRDNVSRASLGYAYINFQQPADAERALDSLNFDELNGKPMRIMWAQRDPTARRSGSANIFIKNLNKNIDNKSMYDTFSLFGRILSCKVAIDEKGDSRGYGFVHFEHAESAQKAISKVNGMLLAGKKVDVSMFRPRVQRIRESGDPAGKFNNVFVKNFGEDINKEALEKLFSKFGDIVSSTVMTNAEGKSKGFGFVCFKTPEAAEKAVTEMNDKPLDGSGKKLTVCRAQKKTERVAELKKEHETDWVQKYKGVNLFVKNLDDEVDEELLRKTFEPYGKLNSVKIMTCENNRSKGFGFVCFENSDEGTKAVMELNSKIICTKPIYVAVAQRKEDRRAQLASQFMQRLTAIRMPNTGMPPPTMYTPSPSQGSYFITPTLKERGYGGMRMQQRWVVPGQPQQFVSQPPFVAQGGMPPMMQRGGAPPAGSAMNHPQQFGSSSATFRMMPIHAPQQPTGTRPMTANRWPTQGAAKPGAPTPYISTAPQKPFVREQPSRPVQGIVVGGQEPLTTHMLAEAAPQEQKQLLGERIYGLIDKMFPGMKNAGKITGMMLEIDNADLLMMLQDTDLLCAKVEEAEAALNRQAGKA